jgi:hypothetical protein
MFSGTANPEAVPPGIVPHIRPIAAGVAQPESVSMRSAVDLEYEHQLVFAAVERSHSAIAFVPVAKVLEFLSSA